MSIFVSKVFLRISLLIGDRSLSLRMFVIRLGVLQSKVHCPSSQLWTEAGVHHALQPGAQRYD
jgi:hypothetical protein